MSNNVLAIKISPEAHFRLVEDTLRRVINLRSTDPDVRTAQAHVRAYLLGLEKP